MSRVRSVRAWGPSTGPTACALAGRRCSLWGWRKGVPGGGAFHHCEGRLTSGAVPPPSTLPPGRLLGSATHVLWARVCWCGGPTLSPWPVCPVGAACRGAGWGPSPGGLTCHRCEGRLVSGAVPPPAARPLGRAAGVPPSVSRVQSVRVRGPSTGPTACALAGRRWPLWGWRKGVPWGVPSTVGRGVCGQALPLPELPAHWAGCWGPPPTCCGRGCVGVGAQHCPLGLHALWVLRAAGVVGGRPRGGGLLPLRGASGVRRCPSPGRPPSGAGSRGSATRVSRVRPVRAWDQAPAPQRAPLRAGVARCGGGGRASPGGRLRPL